MRFLICAYYFGFMEVLDGCSPVYTEPGNLTPVRDSPAIPRLRSVNSYTNIRAATTARNLNKSLQNLNLNEEGRREKGLLGNHTVTK